ncbi:hypothetical protein, partial [Eubacterium sp. An3]|uniref:hypothetical protein n=1 Tax=Eubacterium sp. An3 TaxID=1965628 RepID=UPI001952781F
CRRTAGNPEKRSERKIGANLSLSYRFAPDLYRYEISTVYDKRGSELTGLLNQIKLAILFIFD